MACLGQLFSTFVWPRAASLPRYCSETVGRLLSVALAYYLRKAATKESCATFRLKIISMLRYSWITVISRCLQGRWMSRYVISPYRILMQRCFRLIDPTLGGSLTLSSAMVRFCGRKSAESVSPLNPIPIPCQSVPANRH